MIPLGPALDTVKSDHSLSQQLMLLLASDYCCSVQS